MTSINLIPFVIILIVAMTISCFGGVTIGGVLFMKYLNSNKSKMIIDEISDNELILQSILMEKQNLNDQLETLLDVKIDQNLIDKLILLLQEENVDENKDYDDSNVSDEIVLN